MREAFAHEAHVLTPWLAANLDRISDAVGVPLEDADTEVAVEGFAADILAHDPANGRKVLIENQLEASDHTHLGQIMTYLAGLEASVMVWIAPTFREPHLAAIRWLNEHTVEPFAFFALRLRVVRIGESVPAPLFEVIERPNGWERAVQRNVAATDDARDTLYRTYWGAFSDYLREQGASYARANPPASSWYEVPIGRTGVWFAARASSRDGWVGAELYIGKDVEAVFGALRAEQDAVHADAGRTFEWLPQEDKVSSKVQVPAMEADIGDEADWPRQFAFLHAALEALVNGLAGRAKTAGITGE